MLVGAEKFDAKEITVTTAFMFECGSQWYGKEPTERNVWEKDPLL
jgi:hypothetical protein